MTIDELSKLITNDIELSVDQRGFNTILATFTGATEEQVRQWKRRDKIPKPYADLIRVKVGVMKSLSL